MARLSSTRRDAIDAFVYDWVDDHDLPSMAVSVVTSAGVDHAVAFGSRNLRANDAATPDTLYGIGSVTKSFTACTVMLRVEAGEVALEDSPATHTEAAFDGVEDVTLHQLLSHSSGLPSLAVSEALIARQAELGEAAVPLGSREDFYHYLQGVGPELDEERRYMYSNSAYMLLADVVSAVTGRPFATVVREDLLDPLGMGRSTMDADAFASDGNTMTPYRRTDDGEWEATPVPIRELSRGPGGLFSSVRELGRYLQLYLDGGVAPDGTRVLSEDTIDRLVGAYTETPSGRYGYGWVTNERFGSELHGHSGSIGVSTAYAGWLPEHDLGVAVTCNAAPDHALAHVGEAVVAIALGNEPEETLAFFEKDARQDALTGTYASYRGVMEATVEAVGGNLQVTPVAPLEGEPTTLVFERATDRGYQYWAVTDEDDRMPVEFVRRDDGFDLFFERWRLHRTAG